MKRGFVARVIGLMLACVLILAGCGSPASSDTTDGVAPGKDMVTFRINAEITTLDPHKTAGSGNDQIVQYQFLESLFRTDNVDGESVINMGLAESYKYLDEEKTKLEVKIRPNVKFHNGDTMTADDVVYSLRRSKSTGYNNSIMDFIKSIEKVDEETVLITLEFAYAPIIQCLASANTAIVSKKAMETDEAGFARKPVGTGPYVLDKWVTGEKITFTAFPDYWRGEASIKKGTFIIIADNSTALLALETGEVDFMNIMNFADVPIVRDNPKLSIDICDSGVGGRVVSFNNKKGIFSDVRMRLAVAHAIDPEEIWIGAYDGAGAPSYCPMSRTLPEFPTDYKHLERDIEKAKQLVKDAGYPNGVTVKIPTIDAAAYSKPTVILQEQLAEIGINLEIELMERAAWNERIITNNDYEITYWAVVPKIEDADSTLYMFHSSNIGGGGNFANCDIPELDELLEKGRVMEPGEERNAIYKKALEVIRDNAAIVPCHYANREVAFNAKLIGARAVPTQRYYIYDWHWEE